MATPPGSTTRAPPEEPAAVATRPRRRGRRRNPQPLLIPQQQQQQPSPGPEDADGNGKNQENQDPHPNQVPRAEWYGPHQRSHGKVTKGDDGHRYHVNRTRDVIL